MGASRAESPCHALIQPLEQGCDLSFATQAGTWHSNCWADDFVLASSEVVIEAEASSDFEDKNTLVRTCANWAWCVPLQPRCSDRGREMRSSRPASAALTD